MKLDNFSNTSQSETIAILQITDTHLFEGDDGCLLSVNTADSLHAVVGNLTDEAQTFDLMVATGDISQDHSEASYQRFADAITPLALPCYWLPGNHDFQPAMSIVSPGVQIKAQRHVLLGEHWQMILLDSQVVGLPHGQLSPEQLRFLEEQLTAFPDRHSLILLHHHPVLVGSAWLDQHTLQSSDELWALLRKHNNVSALLCGHVHQELDVLVDGVRVLATPSTCVQFKPNSDDFSLDYRAPGWRSLYLHADGLLETHVSRLASSQFVPDFNASGY